MSLDRNELNTIDCVRFEQRKFPICCSRSNLFAKQLFYWVVYVCRLHRALINDKIGGYADHVQTAQFVDMMSSNGLPPLITRPSRVTATSTTLIDNIFTNNIVDINHSEQGLFITDISDHFPEFHIAKQMEIEVKYAYL